MTVQATLQQTLTFSGTQTGNYSAPIPEIDNATSLDLRIEVAMTAGFQSWATLAGTLANGLADTKGVVIIPAASQTGTILVKGVTGDTGQPISNVNPTTLTWDTYTSTAGLTITGATVNATLIFF